ncbi:hypothetical protein GIT74_03790 [Salmonella enterica]|nr:hypothetical protein [Salmonella enterica]EEK3303775.1 hypothetical protein [Salmonella enterica]EEM4855247.1 hypothetical protein [Salmonella enterica]EGD6149001.1 hypothetical protein [Salmonella enterica]EGG2715779.1 hypothetical protein [Salmonella enterica]
MAIHDAGMFTVKGINRLKILQDAIDRNLHPGQAADCVCDIHFIPARSVYAI